MAYSEPCLWTLAVALCVLSLVLGAAVWMAGLGCGVGYGDEGGCLSCVCSHSRKEGGLIGDNGLARRALTQLSKSEHLPSSEVQLALQATTQGQEMK